MFFRWMMVLLTAIPAAAQTDAVPDQFFLPADSLALAAQESPEAAAGVQVFPNPFIDWFELRTAYPSFDWYLTGAQGNVLLSGHSASPSCRIAAEGWMPGAYYLRVCAPGEKENLFQVVKLK